MHGRGHPYPLEWLFLAEAFFQQPQHWHLAYGPFHAEATAVSQLQVGNIVVQLFCPCGHTIVQSSLFENVTLDGLGSGQ